MDLKLLNFGEERNNNCVMCHMLLLYDIYCIILKGTGLLYSQFFLVCIFSRLKTIYSLKICPRSHLWKIPYHFSFINSIPFCFINIIGDYSVKHGVPKVFICFSLNKVIPTHEEIRNHHRCFL